MDWPEVRQRIAQGEDARTEFKRALELRLVGRAVCAFGNTDGGVLVLGVDDAGQVVGVRGDAVNLRERLANFLRNGCNAPVRARCQQHDTPDGTVFWVEVPRQRGLEPLRCDGRVWVRRDRNTTEPSPSELQELFKAFGYVLTEEQAVTAATVDDIDVRRFHAHLARQGLDLADPQPALEDDCATSASWRSSTAVGIPRSLVYSRLASSRRLSRKRPASGSTAWPTPDSIKLRRWSARRKPPGA